MIASWRRSFGLLDQKSHWMNRHIDFSMIAKKEDADSVRIPHFSGSELEGGS